VAKNDVGIGVLGAGPWGRNLIRALSSTPRARVTAICDVDAARLSDLPASAGPLKTTTSVEAFFGRADVEAVVIATPAPTHAPLVAGALAFGKDVFVEKPMALSATDAAALFARSSACSRKLMVGHVLLYHPAVGELLRRIAGGELGDIVEVHSRRFSTSRRLRHEGPWWSLAPHDVSLMRALFASEPEGVSAASVVVTEAPEAERVFATLSFGAGRTGSVAVGLRESEEVRLVVVIGTRGTVVFDDRAGRARLMLFRGRAEPAVRAEPFGLARRKGDIVDFSSDEPLVLETFRFVEHVLDDRPVPSDGAEGYAVTATLESGARSLAAGGAPFRIDFDSGLSRNLEALPHGAGPFGLESFL
jgi:predicted dehydrogenase